LHDIWKIHVAFACYNLGFANVATHVRDHGINFNQQEKFFVHDRVVQKTRLFILGSAGLLAVKPIVNQADKQLRFMGKINLKRK